MAVSDRKPSAATGLGPRGRRFWRDITASFELERDEIELLVEVCRQLDIVDGLAAALASDGMTTVGSRGQPRPHPCLVPLNSATALLARLMAQLGLPDSNASALASPASTQARRAAQSRWRNHTPRGRRGSAA